MLSLFFVVIIKLDSGWELNKKKLQIISLAELSVVRRRFSHFCLSNKPKKFFEIYFFCSAANVVRPPPH
jgi:hypothetical protein